MHIPRPFYNMTSHYCVARLVFGLFLVGAFPMILSACGSAGNAPSQVGLFSVTLRWDQPADLDLHVWLSPGLQCSQDRCGTGNGIMSTDDIDGTGPETYEAPNESFQNNRFRVGVNLHTFNPPSIPGPRSATVLVTGPGGLSVTYGPYELTEDIQDGGYPVSGNTASWWRPLDIVVEDGSVSLEAPDGTALMDPP